MKILKLSASNIKRLVAVEIEPGGNLVQITGRNGAGKSSVLDAIWWALAGERGIQSAPIRSEEEHASIRLDLGDYVVTREFARRDDDSVTTRIRVEAPDGARYGSPQTLLDGMLGSLAFDPLRFQRASDREQIEMLSELCGIDMDEMQREQGEDYARRRDCNRVAKQKRTAADAIEVPTDAPSELVSVTAIAQRIREAAATNRERETERRRREQAEVRAAGLHAQAIEVSRAAEDTQQQYVREAEDLERRAREVRELASRAAQQSDARSVALTREGDEIVATLASLPPVEPDIDTATMQEEVDQAERINERVREGRAARQRRDGLMDEHRAASKAADELTDRMARRRGDLRDAIAAANLGVEGLTVADGRVMLGDHPFEQASDADRLRASCGIAMRSDAQLRVLRVRHGSLLDEDSLRLLAEMAAAEDYQVWIEMVDTSGKVGIVIEDGRVAGGEPQ